MTLVAFDTHRFVKTMTDAGMPEPQAEALAGEQMRLIDERLSTKQDLEALRVDLKRDIEILRGDVARDIEALRGDVARDILSAKVEIIKWVVSLLLGQTAIILAAIKFLI